VVGAGLQDYTRQTAIHLLAEELNCEYFNNAIDGGSNQRIVRTTIDWLLENNDKWNEVLVLIGWTGILRYEIQQGKKWKQMKSYDGNPDEMLSKYLDSILYLQLFLEANNIKYIFWNTFTENLEKKNKDKWNYINKEHWVTEGDESWEMYLRELEKEKEHDVRVGEFTQWETVNISPEKYYPDASADIFTVSHCVNSPTLTSCSFSFSNSRKYISQDSSPSVTQCSLLI
jgi:hypothetical protein